jgi:hypothetical protein
MPNLSGTGGRSTGVNYATTYWFGRMYSFLQSDPNTKKGATLLALTYQANTGPGAGSLKRYTKGFKLY